MQSLNREQLEVLQEITANAIHNNDMVFRGFGGTLEQELEDLYGERTIIDNKITAVKESIIARDKRKDVLEAINRMAQEEFVS